MPPRHGVHPESSRLQTIVCSVLLEWRQKPLFRVSVAIVVFELQSTPRIAPHSSQSLAEELAYGR
eukprot:5130824-Prymnesium_polylepis.1